MDVHAAIETRRATRSLAPTEITSDLVRDLASHARLSPSCSNNQPWRFVFEPAKLAAETTRPERLPLERFAFLNSYGG